MDTWPADLLLDVVVHLPLDAVLAIRRTCKTLYAFSHLRTLWALLFRVHVLDQHIPFPDVGPVPDLDASQLEQLTRHALTLHRTWTSPNPIPRRQIALGMPFESARVIFLQFLPGRSNRWLISVRMTAEPRSYRLQCWDVVSARLVAELTHADGPYGGVVLNSDPSSPAVLAMQSAQTETFLINFDAQDPESAFETQATIDGIRELRLLSGSTLVTRCIGDGAISLWDLADLGQERIHLLNPSLVQPDDRVHAIHLAHDYALVFRIQSIEIYSTHPRPSLLATHTTPIAYPLAQFKFQWRTDTVAVCVQHAPTSALPSPIHLLVRFGSIYPWPVNILHHYCIPPNPAYGTRRTPSPSSSPHAYTTEYNLPYDPRPRPMHTISSPVRLFGQASMVLGKYGTALWLDNHAETWVGPSERGQRLAGRILWTRDRPEAADSEDPGPSMLFAVHGDDAWTRIAIQEEAGRIALGHVDGAITLLEY